MTYFIHRGNTYTPTTEAALQISTKLPAGVFTVAYNKMQDIYYLEEIEVFQMPAKLYGNVASRAERIMTTFRDRTSSTGVLLSGEKGSGKSLLAKVLACKNLEAGNPCVVINQPWRGEGFNQLIQQLDQHATILFDEFEKTYDREQQEELLTLLDGVYSTKKLFLFTANDVYRIDQFMRNRPGRVFYNIEFGSLEREFIFEYCTERLINKEYVEAVCQLATLFDQFNFDMLQSLVEEMNRFNEPPQEAIEMLNAKPNSGDHTYYDVQLLVNGENVSEDLRNKAWRGSPIQNPRVVLTREVTVKKGDDEDYNEIQYVFNVNDCKRIDQHTGAITYINVSKDGDHVQATFTRRTIEQFSFKKVKGLGVMDGGSEFISAY